MNSFKPSPKLAEVNISVRYEQEEMLKRAKENKNPELDKQVKTIIDGNESKAKYKIEVYFGPDRTINGPNTCQLQFFESGKKLNGDGDDMMFLCMNPEDKSVGCGGLIPGDNVRNGAAFCPNCQKAIKGDALTERLIGRPSTRNLAETITKYFYKLGGSCDIYCKYDRDDIRYVAVEKKLGSKAAHRLRGLHIYPLKNILKDTGNGSSLSDKIYAFLTA